MKFLDKLILDFWYTSPNEWGWAYLANLPLVLVVISLLAQLMK